jgi:hypothetical protein
MTFLKGQFSSFEQVGYRSLCGTTWSLQKMKERAYQSKLALLELFEQ